MMEKRVARGERTLRETREARRDRHQYIRELPAFYTAIDEPRNEPETPSPMAEGCAIIGMIVFFISAVAFVIWLMPA